MSKHPTTPPTPSAKKAPQKKIAVVFVCTGNICRSPVAERLFKDYLKKQGKQGLYRVSSVGVMACVDKPMSQLSQQVLKELKVAAGGHKGRQLSEKIIRATQFFICMTQDHKNCMGGMDNVYTVAEITDGHDVFDPYGGSYADYKKMCDHLSYATPEIFKFIEKRVLEGQGTSH